MKRISLSPRFYAAISLLSVIWFNAAYSKIMSSDILKTASCENVCYKMFYDADRSKCLRSLHNKNFDAKACDLCEGLFQDILKIECLHASANKYYKEFEIRMCSENFYDEQKITCMKENGQYTQTSSTSHCDIEKIKRQIDGAITNLQGGNYVATMNTLQNMKKEITYCR